MGPNADEAMSDWAVKVLVRYKITKYTNAKDFGALHISQALTKVTAKAEASKVDNAITEALRAICILLQDIDDAEPSNTAATTKGVVTALERQGERMAAWMEKMEKAAEAERKAAGFRMEALVGLLQEATQKTDTLATSVEGLAAKKTDENARAAHGGTGAAPASSYAEALRDAPARHADAVAKIEMLKRQVVVNKATAEGADPFAGLTEKEVLAKAQMAVELMAADGEERAREVSFLHARRTSRGGAILVTQTVESAKWLREEANIGKFAEKMGGSCVARADACMVIAEYVPVAFVPEVFTALGQVERDSGLEKGAIREARYIRNPDNRSLNQRVAHMIMGLADPEQANLAIRNGLVIEGKAVTVRRHKRDPARCWKCQQVGVMHNAASCKSIHDTCARCAGMHQTKECKVEERGDFKCANCKAKGHGAADRNCPVFLAESNKIRTRNTDQLYRFFPTSDPTTWERDEATPGEDGIRAGVGSAPANRGPTHRTGHGGDRAGWQERPRDNGWGGANRDGRDTQGGARRADIGFAAGSQPGRQKQARIDDMLPRGTDPRPNATGPEWSNAPGSWDDQVEHDRVERERGGRQNSAAPSSSAGLYA